MPLTKKVLIVDDDSDARQLIRKVLQKLDRIEFLEAESGEEAVNMARTHHPDLILMDVVMPGMDGYEACKIIKSDPLLSLTIVIFMTAAVMDEIDDKMIQFQGDDLLRKPLDASELYFRVKNSLRLVTSIEDPKSEGDCNLCHTEGVIDLGKGILYQSDVKSLCINNQIIPLMKQEILLLETLIKHKNRVVPYEILVNAIAHEEESTIGNVRTLVKLLRHKIYPEIIKNLHSIGYQLIV